MALKDARLVFSKGISKTIGGLSIDAFISENHQMTCSVTEYPVESGGNINDHVIQRPDMLQLQAIQGASPVGVESTGSNRIFSTFDFLKNAKENAILLNVVTGLKVYTDMVITDIRIVRTAKEGGSLPLQITVKNIKIVQSQNATIPNSQIEEGETQAQPEQDIGDTQSGQTQTTEDDNFIDQIESDVDNILLQLGL